MNRFLIPCFITLLLVAGWTLSYGQDQAEQPDAKPAVTYRVMSLVEMFEGDKEARKKIAQMMITVKKGDEVQGFQRTDMDATDYERALNRLAQEGWILVTVNKSNYWVFKKEEEVTTALEPRDE